MAFGGQPRYTRTAVRLMFNQREGSMHINQLHIVGICGCQSHADRLHGMQLGRASCPG